MKRESVLICENLRDKNKHTITSKYMDKTIFGIKLACLSAELTINPTDRMVKFQTSFWKWSFAIGAIVFKD